MAMLLAMYQKMRLIREKNQLVLDQTKVSSKLTRVQKRIEKVQKRYTSMLADAKKNAQMAESKFNNWIQEASGLGMNGINIWNYGAGGGMSQFITQGMMAWASQGTANPNDPNNPICTQQQAERIWNVISSGGTFTQAYEDEAKTKPKNGIMVDSLGQNIEITTQEYQAYQRAMYQVQQMQAGRQQQVNTMKTMYESNVSIFIQAQEEAIEEEQDAMLEPLHYEETMLELEKEQKDTRLKRIEEEIQSYKQLCDNEVKNSTPTFGLA